MVCGDMAGNWKPKLSVFKGREAKLNKAIFWVLAQNGPLIVYDICKKVRTQKPLEYTRYSVINRRVRILVEKGYIKKVGSRKTQAGFQAQQYQLSPRAYLAIMLNKIDLDELIEKANNQNVIDVLTALIPVE